MSTSGKAPQEIWNTLLDSVALGNSKLLSTRNLIVLGGRKEGTTAFLHSARTGAEETRETRKTKKHAVPSACDVPAGYTYIDIEDREMEDTLARLNIYMIPELQTTTLPLLLSFLESMSLRDTTICILLDWRSPWTWLREVRYWIRHLRRALDDLRSRSRELEDELAENVQAWEMRLRMFTEGEQSSTFSNIHMDPSLALPLAQGQFDDPLGLPLFCIAQNAEYITILDREHGMNNEKLDLIQQFLRTILLKHGGSLLYTNQGVSESRSRVLQLLLKEHLPKVYKDISSKTISLMASALERDTVLIPAGWDSWNKIKLLREGFAAAEIAAGWSIDVDPANKAEDDLEDGAVEIFEAVLADHKRSSGQKTSHQQENVIEPIDQANLLQQIEQLQWQVQEPVGDASSREDNGSILHSNSRSMSRVTSRLGEQDATNDEPLKRSGGGRPIGSQADSHASLSQSATPAIKNKDEYVHAFFQNLLTRNNSDRLEKPGK